LQYDAVNAIIAPINSVAFQPSALLSRF